MRAASHLECRQLSLILAFCIVICGCSQRQSADEALGKALRNADRQREKIYPLAGKITIDSQTPHFDKPAKRIVVVLNDTENPNTPIRERPYAIANSHGEFAFDTYFNGDGVVPGKYVLTFAVLRKKGRLGYIGPDELKNLYNDPDANAKVAKFNIEHRAPGKTDYVFDLQVAGREPNSSPGSKALLAIGN